MHPCYRSALHRFFPCRFETDGFPPDSLVLADEAGSLAFTPEGSWAHRGASGEWRLLLEAFCALMDGLPLGEVRDHGVLRLEHALRDPKEAPPVPGLVTPHNADPLLRRLWELVARIPRAGESPWEPAPSGPWHWERVEAALEECLEEMGLSPRDFSLEEIRGGHRFFLAGSGDGARLLELERRLRAKTDGGVEVFLKGREDRNVRRVDHDMRTGPQ